MTWRLSGRLLFLMLCVQCVLSGLGGCNDAVVTSQDPDVTAVPDVEQPADEEVRLQLRVGDRFPLVKTVTQTLTVPGAEDAKYHTTLKMWLGLKVEEVSDDGSRLISVRYDRVQYKHDLGTESVEYDSKTSSPDGLPLAVRVHAGLVNNGFAFRLASDNTVGSVEGFERFLARCVRRVPQQHQGAMLASLREASEADTVIRFVDESIGLLPFRKAGVTAGEVWERVRSVEAPVAMTIRQRFRMTDLREDEARLSVSGDIRPALDQRTGPRLLSGQVVGDCVVDRATGIPKSGSFQHSLKLAMPNPAGDDVIQQKVITTQIETFLPGRSEPKVLGTEPSRLRVREASLRRGSRSPD